MLAEIRKEFGTHKWVYIAALIFIAINAILVANGIYWFVAVPFGLMLLFLAVKRMDWLMLLIAFLTPLSVPSEFYFPDLGFNLQLITEPLLIVVLLIFGYRIILERNFDRRILTHPISWIIYLQLLWLLITSITSSMPLVSFKFLISRLWFLVGFYFVASAMFRRKSMMRSYLWMFILAMLIVAVYAIVNLNNHGLFNQQWAYLSPQPFFRDHTSYGAILAMIIPVVAALGSIRKYSVQLKVLAWIVFSILCIAILFSYTRAAWISIFTALLIFIIIKLKISLKLVGFVGLLTGLILFSYRTEIFIKLEQNRQDSSKDIAKHIESISNIRTDASNLERINRWNSAFRMYHERPLTGWGAGTYMFRYAPFQASHEKSIISTNNGDWGNAHSEFIGPLAETGWPGAALMIVLVIASLSLGLKVYFKSKEYSQERALSLALTLGLLTYFIHGTLNNFLDTDKASALVWGYMAMLVVMDVKLKKKDSEAPSVIQEGSGG